MRSNYFREVNLLIHLQRWVMGLTMWGSYKKKQKIKTLVIEIHIQFLPIFESWKNMGLLHIPVTMEYFKGLHFI